jgi:hypothetical protein
MIATAHLEEVHEMIKRWIDAFDMQQDKDVVWCWYDGLKRRYDALLEKPRALIKGWNRFAESG